MIVTHRLSNLDFCCNELWKHEMSLNRVMWPYRTASSWNCFLFCLWFQFWLGVLYIRSVYGRGTSGTCMVLWLRGPILYLADKGIFGCADGNLWVLTWKPIYEMTVVLLGFPNLSEDLTNEWTCIYLTGQYHCGGKHLVHIWSGQRRQIHVWRMFR